MEDVAELLKTWELPELTPIFAEQRITLQALSAITQDDLKDLIPQIGTRVLFTRCWRTWKNEFSPVVDITNNIQTFSGLDLPNLQLDLELPNYQRDSSDYILMTVKDPEVEKENTSIVPILEPQNETLVNLLKQSLETSSLLIYKGGTLDGDATRNLLASIIAKEILNENRIWFRFGCYGNINANIGL